MILPKSYLILVLSVIVSHIMKFNWCSFYLEQCYVVVARTSLDPPKFFLTFPVNSVTK